MQFPRALLPLLALPLFAQRVPWDILGSRTIVTPFNQAGLFATALASNGDVLLSGSSCNTVNVKLTATFGDTTGCGVIVIRVTPAGDFAFAIQIGGVNDAGTLLLDPMGNIFVGGHAASSVFLPTPGAYLSVAPQEVTSGNYSANFACKLQPADGTPQFCTFLEDAATMITLDSSGALLYTKSALANAHASSIMRLDPAGAKTTASAAIDGTVTAIVTNVDGTYYLAGTTQDPQFPFSTTPPDLPSSAHPATFYGKYDPQKGFLFAQDFGSASRLSITLQPSMGPILAGDFGSGFSVRQYAVDGTTLFWTQTFPSINFALPAAIDRGVVLSGFSTGPSLPLLHNLHVCGQVPNPGSLSNSLLVRIDQTGVTVQSTWLGSSYIGPLVQVDGGWSALGSISGNPSAYAPNAYVQVLSVGPSASAQPMPIGCMADVAQGTKNTASPGMLVNLNIETSAESFVAHPDANGQFPTSLQGISVTFDSVPMPLFALSGQKLSGAVPFSVAGKSASQMCLGVACTKVAIAPVAPSIFTTVVNQDGTVNSATHPAAAGSIVTFYLTGLGSLSPPVADGSIVTSLVPQLVTPVSVQFTSSYIPPGFPSAPPVAAEVVYAGPAPFEVAGVYQINVRVPAGVLGSATIIAGSASAIANVSLSN